VQIKLIAVGTKMPDWVTTGFNEYQKRLLPDIQLHLQEIGALKRHKNTPTQLAIDTESTALMNTIKPDSYTIALDSRGKQWSSEALALQLQTWKEKSQIINILIGGPDGMNPACLKQARQTWSLSTLTLPHPLVRIIVAEQLYRAASILKNHPYHR
jgi:23S rRNA (pseudouridine1915-N3)-methyltransferase